MQALPKAKSSGSQGKAVKSLPSNRYVSVITAVKLAEWLQLNSFGSADLGEFRAQQRAANLIH